MVDSRLCKQPASVDSGLFYVRSRSTHYAAMSQLPAHSDTFTLGLSPFAALSNLGGFFIWSTLKGDTAMTLTAKQEQFAQAIASGMNQSDAYRAAYDAGGMKASSVTEKASELANNVKVTSRVAELQAQLAEKQLWTRQDSVTELAEIARGPESKAAEKIAAIKELNLMHGFNAPTKIEMGGVLIHRIERVIVDAKN